MFNMSWSIRCHCAHTGAVASHLASSCAVEGKVKGTGEVSESSKVMGL